MICREFNTRISALVDGDVEAAERQRLSEHARGCSACATRLETVRQSVRLLADETLFAPPAEAGERLHAALERALASGDAAPPAPVVLAAARRPPAWWQHPNWLLAAALILIFFGGFEWWQQTRLRTWNGWLIDAHCAAKYQAAGKLPAAHPRWCALEAPCRTSGYGVYTVAGRFERFDPAGSRAALAMLERSRETADLRVTVRGRQSRGLIHPMRLILDAPASRGLAVRNEIPDEAQPAWTMAVAH